MFLDTTKMSPQCIPGSKLHAPKFNDAVPVGKADKFVFWTKRGLKTVFQLVLHLLVTKVKDAEDKLIWFYFKLLTIFIEALMAI